MVMLLSVENPEHMVRGERAAAMSPRDGKVATVTRPGARDIARKESRAMLGHVFPHRIDRRWLPCPAGEWPHFLDDGLDIPLDHATAGRCSAQRR
jgi:hypothetical protein